MFNLGLIEHFCCGAGLSWEMGPKRQGAGGKLVGAWLPAATGDRGAHRITFHLVSTKAVSSRTGPVEGLLTQPAGSGKLPGGTCESFPRRKVGKTFQTCKPHVRGPRGTGGDTGLPPARISV